MGGMLAKVGDKQPLYLSGPFQVVKSGMIALPNKASPFHDRFRRYQLRQQKCRDQNTRQIRGADVQPGVLLDFPSKKLAAVSAFFPDNLRPFGKPWVVDQKRTAFARLQCFGLVKTKRGQIPNTA